MMPPLNALTDDQAAADRHRLFGVGTIGYCPVCRRPTSDHPIGASEAMLRVGRHLLAEHDGFFAAMLALGLTAQERPDPFYPAGESW